MSILNYNRNLKNRARELRKNSTLSEVLLWNELKGRKILNCQFLRQKPIENYIVDFYCKELKLTIEIDGSSHDAKIDEDKFRQSQLESLGVTFLRFSDLEVKKNLGGVVMVIRQKIIFIANSR